MGTSNKGNWYKLLIAKMDQAIDNEYYFESLFIEYMIIDDRLKTLAVLSGVNLVKSDDSPKMVGQLISELKSAMKKQPVPHWRMLENGIPLAPKDYLKAIKKEKYPHEKIYECTHVPRQIINYKRSPKTGRYLSMYGENDASLLVQVSKWVEERNHWMHAAGDDNLTLAEYKSVITPLAIDGASFARELCDVTNRIKNAVFRNRRAERKATK